MNAPAEAVQERPLADMAPLIARLRETVGDWPVHEGSFRDESPASFSARTGFSPRRTRGADVVLASDTAVELGHPRTKSCAFVLATWESDRVHHGRYTRVGPDFMGLRKDELHPFGQVVLLQLAPGPPPDPFRLDTAQYLIHRLPGYMVRSVPGRLWVRLARQSLRRGLRLSDVACALGFSFQQEFQQVVGVEVLLVTQDAERVQALSPLATEAEILAGRHRKLVLQPNGDVECADLSCDSCEEKPTCDALRDVVIKRRRKS